MTSSRTTDVTGCPAQILTFSSKVWEGRDEENERFQLAFVVFFSFSSPNTGHQNIKQQQQQQQKQNKKQLNQKQIRILHLNFTV